MADAAESGKLGAPRVQDRGVARRHAFLAAAREVFLEQGYEAASVNDVVRRAGGSLATLYAQFGNKEGLFLAVAQDLHEELVRAMTPQNVDHLPLEEGLHVIGEQFCRNIISRDNLAFFRIIVGEGRHFPEQVQRYLTQGGAEKVRGVIATYIDACKADLGDSDVAASYLLELWRSRIHYRALAVENYALTDEQLATHVSDAIRFFLRAARKVPG
ncbi:MAG: TetR/AcrR family transcriptional regulator [Hyphomonadaceae bacterium]|nr:TetR/AcrR family transcriptional regulator [Hyphomonadaceae bacterium]